MQKAYVSSEERLVDYFERSRNKWKVRALKYQKEKRELLIQLRDIKRSKEKWKSECCILRLETKELRISEKKTKDVLLSIINK